MIRLGRAWWGLLIFAGALAGLEYAAQGRVSWLAARTLAAGGAGVLLYTIMPWRRLFRRLRPGGALYRAALFLVFLRHFTRILEQETWRLYAARRLAVRREAGPGGFRSLAWATTALFLRTLRRAERFHAGLAVRGVEP